MPETEQFRAIATAMLDRRIRNMRRLDEKTWIDTSLITHAEYQLFLNDMYAQGKSYQPEHWKSKRYLSGQAQSPVVGVRPSDAEAFCKWMIGQRLGRFRLPYGEDVNSLKDSVPGFWIVIPKEERKVEYKYKGKIDPLIRSTIGGLFLSEDNVFKLAFSTEHDNELARSLDLPRNFDLNIALDLDLARNNAIELANGLDLYRSRNRDHKLALNHDNAFWLAHNLAHSCSRDLKIEIDLAQTRSNALTISRNLEIGLSESKILLNFVISSLALLSLRREGLLPAFEGILIVREETD